MSVRLGERSLGLLTIEAVVRFRGLGMEAADSAGEALTALRQRAMMEGRTFRAIVQVCSRSRDRYSEFGGLCTFVVVCNAQR